MMLELDAGPLREVGGHPRPLDQLRQSRDVVGLQVRFQHRRDPAALGIGGRDVVVDQIRVRIDHGQLTAVLLANKYEAQAVSSFRELAEVHAGLQMARITALANQVVY